jgi:putative phosphoribosyl transferase
VFIVRKVGAPDQPEYAVGAVCENGRYITNQSALDMLGLDDDWVSNSVMDAAARCNKLSIELRAAAPAPRIKDRDIVLVDDGIATGLTMRAAIAGARSAGASRIIVAVPVLSPDALAMLRSMGLEICYLSAPAGFRAVGQYYSSFDPVAASQVVELLAAR